MPRGTVVIGVGGSGRGVLNYLKRALEQEYGSPEEAGVVLYCIDGPESDQYVLPGGYQIDTSPQSREFYHLRDNPANAIEAIAKGQPFAYVDPWLTLEEARRVPTAGIDPSAGFGGQRVPGRVTLFLEISRLQPALQNVITIARGLVPAGNRVTIVLVGSQSGGTGAGLLLDVAHLLHALKGNDWLIGVVLLPN
ncbi:MAG: tubulin-like doman-containing protein, partial [Candidatus Entotheonellia bacterium]